jgi:hypothetical protein
MTKPIANPETFPPDPTLDERSVSDRRSSRVSISSSASSSDSVSSALLGGQTSADYAAKQAIALRVTTR